MKKKIQELLDKITRKSRKFTDFYPLACVITLVIILISQILSMVGNKAFSISRVLDFFTGDGAVSDFAMQYFDFIGIWFGILLIVYIFKSNRKMLSALKYNGGGNSIKGLLWGLLLGFLSNGICVLLSILLGDIKLSYYGFDLRCILVFIVVIFVQSGAEELATRFYLYQKLRRRYISPYVAIIGNALCFSLMHALNPGFTFVSALEIFVIAILFSLFVYYYDALWLAMAFHMSWNFTQNIIFGLPNSGIVSAYSIFNLEAASARNGLFYNVNFGVEGSIGSSIVLIIMTVVLYYINRNKKEFNDVWKEND